MVLGALLISQNSSCQSLRILICNCMCITMSYYIIKYEFMGQDSAGLRGGEGQFQVTKFLPEFGTSRRILPWATRR
eukprot:COSAG02_NODE_4934_length_4817_cov_5.385333_2_plen_76_part_00